MTMAFKTTTIASLLLLLLVVTTPAEGHSIRGVLHYLGLVDGDNEAPEHQQHNYDSSQQRRRTEDFLAQAQVGKEADALETMEENGDPDDVVVVDSEETLEEENADLENQEEEVEEGLEEDDTFSEEELLLNRRKFVSYESSAWESQWMEQIDDIMDARSLCRTLLGNDEQKKKVHLYLEMLCSASVANWCYYEDSYHYLWYNKENMTTFEIYVDYTPEFLRDLKVPARRPVILNDPAWEALNSKFTFHDEFTGEDYFEYIEPLIGHLRFPLAACLASEPLLTDFKGFVIPPKWLDRTDGRILMYDVGSPDWSRMAYVLDQWALHNINFEFVGSYAGSSFVTEQTDEFIKTVPEEHSDHVYRHYYHLVNEPAADDSIENPDNEAAFFLPTKLRNQTIFTDYVVVKLDRGVDAQYKEAMIDYILSEEGDGLNINELIVDLNARDDYVMQHYVEENLDVSDISSRTLGEIYRMMWGLRSKGIRAHAWI